MQWYVVKKHIKGTLLLVLAKDLPRRPPVQHFEQIHRPSRQSLPTDRPATYSAGSGNTYQDTDTIRSSRTDQPSRWICEHRQDAARAAERIRGG